MATALKDIQFSSPVLNGTTANNKTTWSYGANDIVVFGCGSDGCDYSERHYGCESHTGCEYHYGPEEHCGYESHGGTEEHCGTEYHGGCEEHYGEESHCGCEYHCGYEYHYGEESHYDCEYHCGYEYHSGSEYHCGYEDHSGWAYFHGSCDCSDDGFTGTNLAAYGGIAVVNPSDESQKILLTYANLVAHGFTPA